MQSIAHNTRLQSVALCAITVIDSVLTKHNQTQIL